MIRRLLPLVLPVIIAAVSIGSTAIAPHVARAQVAPQVLAELFSNTNCGNCPTQDEAFESFMKANTGLGIIRLCYHNQITNNQDSFYLAALATGNARTNFYTVSSDPWCVLNGQSGGAGASVWDALCKTVGLKTTPMQLTVTKTSDGIIHIHVTNSVRPSAQVRMYLALTESNIIMNNKLAYGNPSSGHWDDIVRNVLPSPSGTSAFSATGSDSWDFQFDPSEQDNLGNTWDPANMHAVAWLQDDAGTTKKVEALGAASLNVGQGAVSLQNLDQNSLVILGNPSLVGTSTPVARVTLGAPAHVVVTVTDLLGRTVGTLADATLQAGETSIELPTLGVEPGCYVVRMASDGREIAHAKWMVE